MTSLSRVRVLVGMFVHHALNDLWMAAQDGGCCPDHCAPCFALRELVNSGRIDRWAGWWTEGLPQGWWAGERVDRQWLFNAWQGTTREMCCYYAKPEEVSWPTSTRLP